jgi:cytochrome oxidase Cu insertion factor (SCO1/SenC/PrrC family)/DNA-binding beta-propeller fold protein YncE
MSRRFLVLLLSSVLLCAFASLREVRSSEPARLPVIQHAPDFALTTQDGGLLMMSDLKGRVCLVSFVFTTCNGTCPATTHRMAQIQAALKERGLAGGERVRLLTITLDPFRDTPEVLRKYMELYDLAPAGWTFLTGEVERVRQVITAWGLWAKPAANGQLDHPSRVYLVDQKGRIREIYNLSFFKAAWVLEDVGLLLNESSGPRLVLVAGGGRGADGSPAVKAELRTPFGVDFDRGGNVFLVEFTGHRVRKIDRQGILTTIAGTGVKGYAGDGGPASTAQFNSMHGLAVAPDGDLYLADTWNNRVRKIDARTGRITTIAGTGEKGFSGDGGPATQARFGGVYCLALDAGGEQLYVADLDNRRVRKIDLKSQIVATVAGNGKRGIPRDSATATEAPLVDPRAVAVDKRGNLYILERSGHALRVVDPQGKIRTVVGTGKAGANGDSGDARQATLNGPKHLCIDQNGDVIIADTANHLIRRYEVASGKIVRVAGTGKRGWGSLDAAPERVDLDEPHGVAVDAAGILYIVDSNNHRILKLVP